MSPSNSASYSCDGCRAQRSLIPGQACATSPGKITAQGTSVGRPHNSLLVKFASLPRNKPGGVAKASKSPVLSNDAFCLRQNSKAAMTTPANPPWKDMPPCQTIRISKGLAR